MFRHGRRADWSRFRVTNAQRRRSEVTSIAESKKKNRGKPATATVRIPGPRENESTTRPRRATSRYLITFIARIEIREKHIMCSKSRPPPASRAVALRLVVTFTAAAAASTALMVASPSSLPILLGVDAFSPSSRVLSTNQRLLRSFGSFPTAASTSQRINTVRLHAADGNDDDEDDDDKSANESSSDGDEPAPSATAGAEDEVSRQLAKAKELIERTKQKMEKKEKAAATAVSKDDGEAEETTGTVSDDDDDDDEVLPFFAVDPNAAEKRRELVTKTKDEESGLITTDGEKMASLAEGEKWESRGLYDLFENEREEDEENLVKEARASRDVARNMMGLKRIMKKEDFDAIFDKRNLFIGEE